MKKKDKETIKKIGLIINNLEKDEYDSATKKFKKLIKDYSLYQKLENPKKDKNEKITQILLDIDSHLKSPDSISLRELRKYYWQVLEGK